MDEIGKILKDARIEKGYTLDDLQQITKIQKRYLEAIENGKTDILPGRFYARAFVKQYADIVGLDGEKLLEQEMAVSEEKVKEEFAESVSTAPTRAREEESEFVAKLKDSLPIILIISLVLAILVVIVFAFKQTPAKDTDESMIQEDNVEEVKDNSEKEEKEKEDEAEEEEEEEEEEKPEIKVSESTGSRTVYEISGPRPDEQVLKLTAEGGESWVSATVTGGEQQVDTLSDSTEMTFKIGPDTKEINIIIGNAPVTKIFLDDEEIEYAEEAQGVIRQDWQLLFTE